MGGLLVSGRGGQSPYSDTGLNQAGKLKELLKAKGPQTEGPAKKEFLAAALDAMNDAEKKA